MPTTGARGLDDRRPAVSEVGLGRAGTIRDEPHVREGAGQLRVRDVLPGGELEDPLEDPVAWAAHGRPRGSTGRLRRVAGIPDVGGQVHQSDRGGPDLPRRRSPPRPDLRPELSPKLGDRGAHGSDHRIVRGLEALHPVRDVVEQAPVDPDPGLALDAVGEPVEGVRAAHEQPVQRPELHEGQGTAPGTEALEDREGAAQRGG